MESAPLKVRFQFVKRDATGAMVAHFKRMIVD